MQIADQKIKELLLAENYVTAEDIKIAEDYAVAHNVSFVDDLYNRSLITKEIVGQAIAEHYNVPYVDLNAHAPDREQVLRIPEELAKKFHLVFFSENEEQVNLATDDPEQENLVESLQVFFTSKKISLVYTNTEFIEAMFVNYRQALETRFSEIIKKEQHVAPQIFDEILNDALTFRASDIHLEPQGKEVLVRFRIDGVLHEAGRIPRQYYDNILNRIKVQSNLRIDEHFAAQDGSVRIVNEEGKTSVDLRISILPTLDGEKLVARILSQYVQRFTLADLGFSEKHQGWLIKAAKKPFGMIIVAGPTGSGKTTTLYSLVKYLSNPEINITTIEDPVEYRITGINQIQVNPRTNLTFASGLKSIVRQDPDIVLVGEIRDRETAEIAVNAALTGHLLLSTFHANDSATAIPRLLDMGIEPFLLSSTLELVISERLVRRICKNCRQSVQLSTEELQNKYPVLQNYFTDGCTLYKGSGCAACGGTGFKGRMGIFEFIYIDPAMKDLILKRPSTQEIWGLAENNGSSSMFVDGLEKVKNGVTTIEELLRVVEPPRAIKKYVKK